MSIIFHLHDYTDMGSYSDTVDIPSTTPTANNDGRPTDRDEIPILAEKLTVPDLGEMVARPRLHELLEKSLSQCCATLISGRAGTGKTALAVDFARKYSKVAWYTVESTDVDWKTFSAYFAAALSGMSRRPSLMRVRLNQRTADSESEIDQFLIDTFGYMPANRKKPILLVLDDLHRIFDAEWFGDFFNMLVYSLPENIHLLLLCRSKPPAPLWRLRSKQMLNVIDEKLLAFDEDETARLFSGTGISDEQVRRARSESFGRVSKLLEGAGPN